MNGPGPRISAQAQMGLFGKGGGGRTKTSEMNTECDGDFRAIISQENMKKLTLYRTMNM